MSDDTHRIADLVEPQGARYMLLTSQFLDGWWPEGAGVTPLLSGGQLDSHAGSLVGPLACGAVSQLLVDR